MKEINIFRTAETKVNKDQVAKWLEYLGADEVELDDCEISDPSLLVALAAKRCYNSFQPGLNPNVTKVRRDWVEYLDNILASGHGCYDSETEVLTSSGWIPWPKVKGTEQFATLNKDGELEYQEATGHYVADYNGLMVEVKSNGIDLLVTPNHRMFVCTMNTKQERKKGFKDYRILEAGFCTQYHHAYWRTAEWLGNFEHFDDEAMQMIGFAIGDGSRHGAGFSFHLHKERKIRFITSSPYLVRSDGDRYYVEIPGFDPNGIYDQNAEKIIPYYLLSDSSNLDELYYGLMEAGGCYQQTHATFDTTSKKLSDQFFELCLKIGKVCNLSKADCYNVRHHSFGHKKIYRHQIVNRNIRPEINKTGSKNHTKFVPYKGTIHCVQVPNGLLYVRRGGRAVWSGNSVLEHSCYTYAIEGCTRVFTAEMNRHRAGVGISEASLRYIRFEKEGVDLWLPPSLSEDDPTFYCEEFDVEEVEDKKVETVKSFMRVLNTVQEEYNYLCNLWELDELKSFGVKKKLTSMMRRIVPLGVQVGGVWTMNIRAMRHIISMRHSEHAEEEICLIFSLILKDIMSTNPELFGDFKMDENTGYYVPTYWKV